MFLQPNWHARCMSCLYLGLCLDFSFTDFVCVNGSELHEKLSACCEIAELARYLTFRNALVLRWGLPVSCEIPIIHQICSYPPCALSSFGPNLSVSLKHFVSQHSHQSENVCGKICGVAEFCDTVRNLGSTCVVFPIKSKLAFVKKLRADGSQGMPANTGPRSFYLTVWYPVVYNLKYTEI